MMTPIADSAITDDASSRTLNYNYNTENYYPNDDLSVYNDVNNNRLNLRRSSNSNTMVRPNAYEERNIYVSNNALSDNANGSNDSTKSYIHIEVYKGNLDNGGGSSSSNTATVRPKETRPADDSSAIVGANADAFDVTSAQMGVASHFHPNIASPDSITELSSTTIKT